MSVNSAGGHSSSGQPEPAPSDQARGGGSLKSVLDALREVAAAHDHETPAVVLPDTGPAPGQPDGQ
jgi:hypothetical protein